MKLLIISLLFLCQFKLLPAQGTASFPKIADVVKEFYGNYSMGSLDYPKVFFEKKKEGWFIVTKKAENNELVDDKRLIFYDNKKKAFVPLPLERTTEAAAISVEEYVDTYDLNNFDLQLFFGYPGWYKDVIHEMEGRKDITDDELYALGRAYDSYATSFLSAQYGDGLAEDMFIVPFTNNCLTPDQIQKYIAMQDKAIDCFGQLNRRTPFYQTTVGSIGIKFANQQMVVYHMMLVLAQDYAAGMQLPPDIYPDSILQKMKNALMACPRESIFLSFGDNDFYPVLYLQHREKIRQDVYLVNYSLLGMERYIFRATAMQFKASPIELSVDSAVYKNPGNSYFYVDEKEGEDLTVGELMTMLETEKGDPHLKIECERLLLKSTANGNMQTQRVLSLKNTSYVLMNQWVTLDMLDNLDSRKVCMINGFYDNLKGLNEYLDYENGIFVYGLQED